MVQREVIGGVMRRLLAALKPRSTLQDTTLRELLMDASWLRVLAPGQMDASVLAHAANETGARPPRQVLRRYRT
jgi:hypothetical protein